MLPRSKWTDEYIAECFEQRLDNQDGRVYGPAIFEIEERSATSTERSVNGVANVERISRSGHKFSMSGADLSSFQANPVVLAGHMQMSLSSLIPGAIGVVEKVSKHKDQLRFKGMKFDSDPLSELWFQKVASRTIRMVSIGAHAIEWDIAHEEVGRGKNKRAVPFIDVSEWELVEISVVPIGANQGAMINPPRGQQLQTLDNVAKRIDDVHAALRLLAEQQDGTAVTTSLRNIIGRLDAIAG